MKTILSITAAIAILAPCAAQAGACDTFKNATYGGVMRGPFGSEHPDAFSAARVTFDAQGVGQGRGLLGYEPADTAAVQAAYTGVTCIPNADGKSGLLNFGGSLGNNTFTVFDGGARVWTEHAIPGRPLAGWLFRLPPRPR